MILLLRFSSCIMDNQIIKNNAVGRIGFLTRIILQFYARNRSNVVNFGKIIAVSWAMTTLVSVRKEFDVFESICLDNLFI